MSIQFQGFPLTNYSLRVLPNLLHQRINQHAIVKLDGAGRARIFHIIPGSLAAEGDLYGLEFSGWQVEGFFAGDVN